MDPETLKKIAQAISSATHPHLGITANQPKPLHSPAVAHLARPDLNAFSAALDNAREQCPDCPLALVGAHGSLGGANVDDPTDTLPPGFLQFLDPDVLVPLPAEELEAEA